MSNNDQAPTLQEQMALLQQQLQQQQQQQDVILQLLQQQQQPQQSPAPQPQPMQDSDNLAPPSPRVKYEWTPSPALATLMDMHHDLFVGTPLTDRQRASLIDLYPPITGLDYRPPDAVPEAHVRMNDHQRSHDASLKSIQYLLSAIFRPLDLLAYQLLNQANNSPDIQQSLKTLHDARALLLNASNSVNTYRNGIAIKAINKAFKPDLSGDSRHTMPSDQFHSLIGQLNSTNKTIKEAHQGPKPFRAGPPSQHGGKTSNSGSNVNNHNNNNSNNRFHNKQRGNYSGNNSTSSFSQSRHTNNNRS